MSKKKEDFDVYKACAECRRRAKKWAMGAFYAFIFAATSATLFFQNMPGHDIWDDVFCVSLVAFVICVAMAYCAYMKQLDYSHWGNWF